MLSMILNKIRQIRKTATLREFLQLPEINIHDSVKFNFDRITLKNNNKLEIGNGSIIDGALIFERDGASISIGSNSFVNGSVISAEQINIGSDVLIAWGCTIVDHGSHSIFWEQRKNDVANWYAGYKDWTHVGIATTRIENKVWIGFNTIILKGVTVGEGSFVAAGSVVTKNVAPYTAVAGNPAKNVTLPGALAPRD